MKARLITGQIHNKAATSCCKTPLDGLHIQQSQTKQFIDVCLPAAVMQVGFFADAGPLQLFVSNHLIPEDFSYDSANEPAFVSSDEAVRVQAGAEVRLRIVGTRVDADEIVSCSSLTNTLSACAVLLRALCVQLFLAA